MSLEIKWHIYDIDSNPLTWEDKQIDFDTYEAAEEFLFCIKELTGDMCEPYEINGDILFYDGGHINLTNYLPKWSEPEGDEIILVERNIK